MQTRFRELDSLRGLAALAVFFSHVYGLQASADHAHSGISFLAIHSPFHALWGGHEAVIMFFVLSGYVLSLPWQVGRAKLPVYAEFITKRICRIWIPYIAAVLFSLICRALFYGMTHVPETSSFFESTWRGSLTLAKMLNIASLAGYFDSHVVNGVIWSLTHEMRISLIFPLLMIVTKGRSPAKILVAAIALSEASGVLHHRLAPTVDYDIFMSLHYTAFFLLGAVAASRRLPSVFLLPGVLLYTYAWWFMPLTLRAHAAHIDDWMIALGSCLLIGAALGNTAFSSVLKHRACEWIGQRSYSFYLYHLPVMVSVIYLLRSPLTGALLSLPVSLWMSDLSYRFVECPAIGIGRRLSGNISFMRLHPKNPPITSNLSAGDLTPAEPCDAGEAA